MRRRAYCRILVAAVVVTLIATTLAPDTGAPPLFRYPQESPLARSVVTGTFESIAWPPQVVARALGIWIDSHSAQMWRPGWPVFTAFSAKLLLIAIPFWWIAGVIVFELSLLLARRIRRPAAR